MTTSPGVPLDVADWMGMDLSSLSAVADVISEPARPGLLTRFAEWLAQA